MFNFEGGCYAKVIRLSPVHEPQIFNAIRFGSILENVIIDPLTRAIDWDDDSITENTRATYPVTYIPNAIETGLGGMPRNVFLLACDAYGVLPPITRLTPGDGQLPLPLRLHRQGRRHRGRRRRAGADVLGLLRRAVHAARPRRVRGHARRAAADQPDAVLAGQHRLVRAARHGEAERMPIEITRSLLKAALEGTPWTTHP